MSLGLHLSSRKSFDKSGINTTSILNHLINHTGTKLEMLAIYPAGKAQTMPLTLRGRPGRVETPGQVVLFRLQEKPLASSSKDSLTANQDTQLIVEGYPLMQDSQRAQSQAQQQTEATP